MTMLETISLTLAVDDGPPVLPDDAPPAGQPQPAQPTEGQPGPGEAAPPQQPQQDVGGFGALLPLIVLGVLLLMFVLMTSGQRKERKRHQQMLSALKKGDKVQTVGGIIGTLVELRDNEVVLKVDENTNTRLRFARNAVKDVVESKEE